MKKSLIITISLASVLFNSLMFAQEQVTPETSEWSYGVESDFYFTDPFIFLPIITVDKGKLHIEARYNYEDLKTASAWVGCNIFGGDKFEYFITPMVGGVFGRTNGTAPGFECTLGYGGFELYNESEYLFDFASSENNFFYSWTDLTYSPLDWFWFGISGQRMKLYQTEVEIDRGLIIGGSYKQVQITGYLYNPFTDDVFFMLALTTDF
jgi:hypothetical protein